MTFYNWNRPVTNISKWWGGGLGKIYFRIIQNESTDSNSILCLKPKRLRKDKWTKRQKSTCIKKHMHIELSFDIWNVDLGFTHQAKCLFVKQAAALMFMANKHFMLTHPMKVCLSQTVHVDVCKLKTKTSQYKNEKAMNSKDNHVERHYFSSTAAGTLV